MNDMRQELIQTRGSATFAFDAEVSIELAPAQARTFAPPADCFPLGSRVFLTHLPGKPEALQI
ncbi:MULTISPECIES: hypothetical protein [unclassified Mesorhizobium]|nr:MULTISPECIES: hypothetical protein [unclassified Mesorhizobium]